MTLQPMVADCRFCDKSARRRATSIMFDPGSTKPNDRAKMLVRLLAMQRQDGGFVTDYDAQGKPVGQANVETTSLAILALDGEAGA